MKDILITNNTSTKFLDKIKQSLAKCINCYFSVSFIKKAGLVLFEKELESALKRGVGVKIITSTYQNFTDIASLELFNRFQKLYSKFECHLDLNCFGDNGFHSKGYIFEYDNEVEFIVGSTNITRYAILKNIEWNVSLFRKNEDKFVSSIIKEFNILWDATYELNEELIDKYKIMLSYAIEKWDMDYFNPSITPVKPNSMQRGALKELRRYRDLGVDKALVVAATGSGKTYLAAFDARNFSPNRLLYIVHRDTILNDALNTFKKVFGYEHTYGFYTGRKQDLGADFIFASSSMIARHLDEFNKDTFDYIIYDEVHHIMAENGQKIFTYFEPTFLLGLTATPERMDDKNVLELFENNVPFELRLRDAIINDLVVPFHYYAIRDEFADYSSNDKAVIAREISKNINVEFIRSQIELRRELNKKLKCLAFCSSIEHCKMMAQGFNEIGYNAIALTGSNNFGERILAFKELQDDSKQLEIICTVDILNEGVDIPSVNMVLFLRPTESQTIFLQQLGRGLRKYPDKEYVTVLDFIGNNYERSIQIALALGTLGKTTYTEKAYLSEMVRTDFYSLNIPGVEIFFDELAKVDIINYINKQNFNKADILKKDYQNFKKYMQIDSYPLHVDYINSDISPDIIRFMKSKIYGKKNKSYYSFLKKIGEETLPYLEDEEVKLIDEISELLPIVRCDEMLIIKQLLENGVINLSSIINFNDKISESTLKHSLKLLISKGILNEELKLNCRLLSNDCKMFIDDIINYALLKYEIDFGTYSGKFKLMANYYKEQIAHMLNRFYTMDFKQTGILYPDEQGNAFFFVCLQKDKTKAERVNYKDKFINSKLFQWESQTYTTVNNSKGVKLSNIRKVNLFIKKMDKQDEILLPFTYFGTGILTNCRESYVISKDKEGNNVKKPTLLFDIILDNEVSEEYYLDFEIPKGNDYE